VAVAICSEATIPCGSAALFVFEVVGVRAGEDEGDLGASELLMVDCEEEVVREKVLLIPRWVLCSFCVIFLVGFHDMAAGCAENGNTCE
jgi:hypothetical protein